MLFSIVEGSGSIARCSMLVHSHSGEITPTIMEAPTRVQLHMVKDPGVKLLGTQTFDHSPLTEEEVRQAFIRKKF